MTAGPVSEDSSIVRAEQFTITMAGVGDRPVRVHFQCGSRATPSDTVRDGLLLLIIALVTTLAAGLLALGWASGPSTTPTLLKVAAILVPLLAVWLWVAMIRTLSKGLRDVAGRHVVHGYVIDRRSVNFDLGDDAGGVRSFVAVDDGQRDEITAWMTENSESGKYPLGSAVSVTVSRDRRHRYRIRPATPA